MTSGAQLLADAIRNAGVRTVFNLSGNQIMPLYSPLVDAGIDLLHVRHEAAAVHMADAWSRLTEQPSLVLLTAGPGHANALGATYVARMAESPVVILSGASELSRAGQGAFQEIDQAGMAKRVAKAAWLSRNPARLGDDLARAFRLAATGRPGPVSLSLPADVLRADAGGAAAPPSRAFRARRATASDTDARALLETIGRARRPLLLAGPAVARGSGWTLVRRLAERTGAPALPMDSSRGANDPTLGGVRTIFPKADLAVLVDRDPDFSLGFGRPPVFAPDVRLVRTSRAVVERAIGLPGASPTGTAWAEKVAAAMRLGRETWPAVEASSDVPMHPLRLVAGVRAHMQPGDVFVSDGGEFGQWAQAGAASLDPSPDRVVNGPSGAIGAAIPFAIGAALARPDARIFAFQGDGACAYHLTEVDTAVRRNLPFVLTIGNDGKWNAEVQIQRNLGGAPLDCLELGPVRYDRAAAGLGAHGEWLTRPDEVDGAVRRALATGKPAVLNALIQGIAAPTFGSAH